MDGIEIITQRWTDISSSSDTHFHPTPNIKKKIKFRKKKIGNICRITVTVTANNFH